MLDKLSNQYNLPEEIELMIYEYLHGSIKEYKSKMIFNINKNILNYSAVTEKYKISNYIKYNELNLVINKLKYKLLDFSLIHFEFIITKQKMGMNIIIINNNEDEINKIYNIIMLFINKTQTNQNTSNSIINRPIYFFTSMQNMYRATCIIEFL